MHSSEQTSLTSRLLSSLAPTVMLLMAALLLAAPPADADTILLSGKDWLNGQGVDVYANDNGAHECVELVNRLYSTRGWISGAWSGNANQMYGSVADVAERETADPDGDSRPRWRSRTRSNQRANSRVSPISNEPAPARSAASRAMSRFSPRR